MIARRASPCVDSSQRIVRDSRTLPKLRSQNGENIEAHFLERAKYYQFAAAMTENPQEIERLCDIAFMFERMAHDVRRLRLGQSRFPASDWHKAEWPPAGGGAAGFVRIWGTLAEFISRWDLQAR
jgi:hypothetical protein